MSRALPKFNYPDPGVVARQTAAPPRPRFITPPGVVLRLRGADEHNPSPVLVCAVCGPAVHVQVAQHIYRCPCGRERSW